jgi:two-component system alkaline phosphatase synthesis response regulator PhoP
MGANAGRRIMLVDDDRDLLELLRYNFEKDGFEVKTVSKIKKVIALAQKFQPHLIVLDIKMPDGSGIDLCRDIRHLSSFKNNFIFFLTAHAERQYRDAAWKTGADDFIEKVSGLRALTNKVNAVLKSKFIIKKGVSGIVAGGLVVDKYAEVVYYRDQEMVLSSPEFEILFFLMQNPNKVVSGKMLVSIIWGSEIFAIGPSIDSYIDNLQRKIGRRFIETVSKGQYRFNSSKG